MRTSRFAHGVRVGFVLAGLAAASMPVMAAAQVNISMRAWRQAVLMDTLRQDHHLKAAPEKVYEAALKAFAELDLPTGQTDGRQGIITTERFERTHALVGKPMSRSFNCGETVTGPLADSYRLEIAVVLWVADDKPGTKLGLATIASGRDISGTGLRPRECASLGFVETRLLETITKMVGG
jgi:hypothetical protein